MVAAPAGAAVVISRSPANAASVIAPVLKLATYIPAAYPVTLDFGRVRVMPGVKQMT